MPGIAVERRSAHRAEQHRIGRQASLQRIIGKGVITLNQGCAAYIFAGDAQLVAKSIGYSLQHTQPFLNDFGANAIAR